MRHTPNRQICGPVSSLSLRYIRETKIDISVKEAAEDHPLTARARATYKNIRETQNMWNQQPQQQRVTPFTGIAAERASRWSHNGYLSCLLLYSSTHYQRLQHRVGARSYLAHNEAQWLPLCICISSHSILFYNRGRPHACNALTQLPIAPSYFGDSATLFDQNILITPEPWYRRYPLHRS